MGVSSSWIWWDEMGGQRKRMIEKRMEEVVWRWLRMAAAAAAVAVAVSVSVARKYGMTDE